MTIFSSLGVVLSKILAVFMTIITCFISPLSPINTEMPEVPEKFVPVLRFVVASDVHINMEEQQVEKERLAQFINKSYELAENSSTAYKKLDGIFFAGDVANSGMDEEAQLFIDIVNENVREGTVVRHVLGNHDLFKGKDTAEERFSKIFGSELNYSIELNGYTFIGVSYDEKGGFGTSAKRKWLNNALKEATEKDSSKPVFVFQHPHPFGTVYGSVNWGDLDTANVYTKYSQAVVFSGHSHYPINDPRSIWQGSYTSLGTGTLSYFEMEKDCFAGQFPEGYDQAAQFRVVEVDSKGNVVIRNYDLITDSYFGEEYFLTGFGSSANFKYTSRNRESISTKPVFEKDTTITASKAADGNTVLSFKGATDKNIVHDYKITITNKLGIIVYSQSIMSHYYLVGYGDIENLNLGEALESGEYTVLLTAQNPYGKISLPISAEITV